MKQFELEIEYIGSTSNTFDPPPIVKYAETIHDESPYMLVQEVSK